MVPFVRPYPARILQAEYTEIKSIRFPAPSPGSKYEEVWLNNLAIVLVRLSVRANRTGLVYLTWIITYIANDLSIINAITGALPGSV